MDKLIFHFLNKKKIIFAFAVRKGSVSLIFFKTKNKKKKNENLVFGDFFIFENSKCKALV
jgi:hypothetical protein